jgi:glucose/arabinose dehydrogenase
MNTEHGPKGGDEVNFNFLDEDRPKNFGWPISSYGEPYPGYVEVFKKNGWMKTSHKENGFVEPVKQFTPSIGISELFYVKNNSEKKHNHLFVSSLRAGSIYILTLDETFKKVLDEDRLYFPNKRIRDLKYDKKNNQLLFLSEYTPSIAVLKKNE